MKEAKFYHELFDDGSVEYVGYGIYDERLKTMIRHGFGVKFSEKGHVIAVGIFGG